MSEKHFHILGMSASQLTNSYFSEGQVYHQPGMFSKNLSYVSEASVRLLLDATYQEVVATWWRPVIATLVKVSPDEYERKSLGNH
jgi:hypothetical protein